MPWQASGCATELSPEEVEAGEVDQLVKRLVTLVNEVRRGVGPKSCHVPAWGREGRIQRIRISRPQTFEAAAICALVSSTCSRYAA